MTLFSPVLFPSAAIASATPAVLPGTAPLAEGHGGVGNWDGVISAEIDRATAARPQHWKRDFSSTPNYDRSIEPNRTRFAHIIGARVPFDAPALLATVDQPALVSGEMILRFYGRFEIRDLLFSILTKTFLLSSSGIVFS